MQINDQEKGIFCWTTWLPRSTQPFFVQRVRCPGVWQLWLSLNEIGWCESVQNKWSGIDLNISPTCNQQSNHELRGFAQYIAVSLMRISICTHLSYEAMQNESTELCSISHVCSLYFPWKVYWSVYIAIKPVEVLLRGNLYILQVGVVLRLYVALTSGTLTSI